MKKFVTLACAALVGSALALTGCSSNQTVKNAWKSTRSVWYTYASPPATIDYDDKSGLDAHELLLTSAMLGVDMQLRELERVMVNADKPPTSEWIAQLFARFPWLDGFAGVKADGSIIGQEPAAPVKPLDYTPLLEPDPKQHYRALRGIVQDTPMGPEVMLAVPLYDAEEFLGIVVTYFDLRNLVGYSADANELIVTSPQALLWQGQYQYEQTPLASVKWDEVLRSSVRGTLQEGDRTFYWMARYLGNQPLVFASCATGKDVAALEKAAGDPGALAPMPALDGGVGAQQAQDVGPMEVVRQASAAENLDAPQPEPKPMPKPRPRLRQQAPRHDPAAEAEARRRANIDVTPLGDDNTERQPPSPFGPRQETPATPEARPRQFERPSPFGPRQETPATPEPAKPEAARPEPAKPEAAKPEAARGGQPDAPAPRPRPFERPSPFGPGGGAGQ